MSGQQDKNIKPFRRLWQRIKNRIVQEVPEESAVCEFDCPKDQCTVGEWKACERRVNKGSISGSNK
jgi:hypothetical protein